MPIWNIVSNFLIDTDVTKTYIYRCSFCEGGRVDSTGDWVLGLSGRCSGDTGSVTGVLLAGQSRSSDRGEVACVDAVSSDVTVCRRLRVGSRGGGVVMSTVSEVLLAFWRMVGSVSSSWDGQTGIEWAWWTWLSSSHGELNVSEHWPHVSWDGCCHSPASDDSTIWSIGIV